MNWHLRTHTKTYWHVLTLTDTHWNLLTHTDTYWHLQTPTRTKIYWHVLILTDTYWQALTLTDTWWHLLTHTDTYWHILTLTDTYQQSNIAKRPIEDQICKMSHQKKTTKTSETYKPSCYEGLKRYYGIMHKSNSCKEKSIFMSWKQC